MTHYRKDHKHVNNAKKKHKTVRKFTVIYNPNHTTTGGNKTTKVQWSRHYNLHTTKSVSYTHLTLPTIYSV